MQLTHVRLLADDVLDAVVFYRDVLLGKQ